jgi:hypothetical protein
MTCMYDTRSTYQSCNSYGDSVLSIAHPQAVTMSAEDLHVFEYKLMLPTREFDSHRSSDTSLSHRLSIREPYYSTMSIYPLCLDGGALLASQRWRRLSHAPSQHCNCYTISSKAVTTGKWACTFWSGARERFGRLNCPFRPLV